MSKTVIARMCVATATVIALAVSGSGAAVAAPAAHHQPMHLTTAQEVGLRQSYAALAAAAQKGDLSTVKATTYAISGELPNPMARGTAMAKARSLADQLPGTPLPTTLPGPGATGTVAAVCKLLFGLVATVVGVVEGILGPLPVPSLPDICGTVSAPPVPGTNPRP